jgi:chaperone BCS1
MSTRLLFLTTNAITSLDPALVRAGRVDLLIDYKLATPTQAAQLFEIFYTPSQSIVSDDILNASNNSNKKKDSDDSSDAKHVPQPFDLPEDITKEDISLWAKAWASHLPDNTFSIAELQGMLLAYKKDPQGASLAMPSWVEKETQRKKEEEEEKERARKEQEEQEKKGQEEEKKKESQAASLEAKKSLIKALKEASESKATASTSQNDQAPVTDGSAVSGHQNGAPVGESSAGSMAGPSPLSSPGPPSTADGSGAAAGLVNGTSKGKEPEHVTNGSNDTQVSEASMPAKEDVSE